MCGIGAAFGPRWSTDQLDAMRGAQVHRGPDMSDTYLDPAGAGGLVHNRLSILDLSDDGRQPMRSADGRYWIAFNGEVYNYVEIRRELGDVALRSQTDTEVVLAAYQRWGAQCLNRFIGMFAFAVWDEAEQTLFAARDRFGVKPLYYHQHRDGTLLLASEIKALIAAGVTAQEDAQAWANYLTHGTQDQGARTFWRDIHALPAAHALTWQAGRLRVWPWYDIAAEVGPEYDSRPEADVIEHYVALLIDSVRLRFRSDVPVGINLSGGLDSSILLALVHRVLGGDGQTKVFSFATGDPRYDELPWIRQMLAGSDHPWLVCTLDAADVPRLADSVSRHQDEPFGGIPTLAYAQLFQQARAADVTVLLDGQGLDEQWAGYDYYRTVVSDAATNGRQQTVQGTRDAITRCECLTPEFRALASDGQLRQPFPDRLRNLQYRDLCCTKLPRALRYNDRVSMQASTELREPFLDHRLVELAMRQPADRKLRDGTGKYLLRQAVQTLLPQGVCSAPKRALQTPQREWLRQELRDWADGWIETALQRHGGTWLDSDAVRHHWRQYQAGASDNSFYVWQWISLGMLQMPLPVEAALPG